MRASPLFVLFSVPLLLVSSCQSDSAARGSDDSSPASTPPATQMGGGDATSELMAAPAGIGRFRPQPTRQPVRDASIDRRHRPPPRE